jgi:chaperone required for assembly of F1-ATPase
VLLDGRPARTPRKRALDLPGRALAEAVAAEWAAQGERMDPVTMPLTRLVNSAIDGVRGREHEVAADIVRYAGSDLVCYRAGHPDGLVARQQAAWDPVLAWAAAELGVRLVFGEGLMPVAQPTRALEAVAATLGPLDAFRLTALHVMTTLTGSCLIALAHARGRLPLEEAWCAAHIDEDWQAEQWGIDHEAAARRAHRLVEMQAASRLLALLG